MNNKQWRLPNIEELKSLLWGELSAGKKTGYATKNPAAQATFLKAFDENSISGWIWSSSTHADFGDYALGVNFNCGVVDYSYEDNFGKVLLVRDDMTKGVWQDGDDPTIRYLLMGGSIIDNKTNLQWKREPESGIYTWQEAMKLYENL